MHLHYLQKLSRPKYQYGYNLNKIMKILHEDAIWIKKLLSELPDKGWKRGSIDSLLKRICKMGTIVQQSGSGRLHSSHSSGGPYAQLGGQAKKAPIRQ